MAGPVRRKSDPDRKTAVIPVRCTAKQKKTLEKRAKARGLGVSTWLLQLGLSASDDPRGDRPSLDRNVEARPNGAKETDDGMGSLS